MKKYRILFMMMLGLVAITSCSDLEEDPILLISPENVFSEAEDLQSGVGAAYSHAINEEIWGRKLSVALMLRSDMVNLQSDQTRRVEMNQHTITADNEMVYDPWDRIYQGIAAANTVIYASQFVTGDTAQRDLYVAQARFIRGWYYFHLVRLFGDLPYISEPVTGETIVDLQEMTSTPEAEVYANIIADFQYAEANLPTNVSTESRSRPSIAAAKSYLALVYLTMAGTDDASYFQLAYDKAKEVINNAGTYGIGLDSDFQALFNADRIDSSIEPLFVLDYNNVEADDNAYDQISPMTGVRSDDDDQGWSVAVPTLAVYNSFDEDDYRTRVSFQTEASINGTTVDYTNFTISGHEHAADQPYIAKYSRYPGAYARGNKRATSHNYSMIRYAEVLLIAAEAGVEVGATDALSLLNQVRDRARNGGNSTNGGYVEETIAASTVPADLTSITVADVIEERRIELAFEGKRWYDIKRRQLGNDVFSATGYEGAKAGWDANIDYDTPLPQTALVGQPNLTN